MPPVAPYGEWVSPIPAESVAASAHVPDEARFVGDEAWWTEPIAAERRQTLMRRTADGVEAVLPAPWNVRSGVHEYGGGAWTVIDGTVVFSHLGDHRLYRLDGLEPRPLTPEGRGFRFGGLVPGPSGRVLAVREIRLGDGPADLERDLVTVPLDGSAADDPAAIASLVGGSRFLAQPALSLDGSRLAWIAWDHPDMPWDATELRVGDVVDGRVPSWNTVLGGPGVSVVQPEWLPDGSLAACSDASGWWNVVRVDPASGRSAPLLPEEREQGGPLWVLGARWFLPLPDGRILLTSRLGSERQVLLDPASGVARTLRDERSATTLEAVHGDRVLLVDHSAADPGSLWQLDLATERFEVVRAGLEGLPLEAFPRAAHLSIDGVHVNLYAPHNPGWSAPAGELPPFVVLVHGGPTSQAILRVDPRIGYYTSRGIGVADVDYGGSTGYGRDYRERLRGQWGVVDVADVVAVARGLGERRIADPRRVAIEGGSAGGWTVLAALTRTDAFAAGISLYGIADLVALALDTHDFEARYLDGLVGPYPEASEVYAERAPVNHVDGLATPVLLLQGLEDRVVPPAQSRLFRDAAAARGVPHALIEFPGEGHGFRGRDAIVGAREAALSFLGQTLGFTPPGVPRLELS